MRWKKSKVAMLMRWYRRTSQQRIASLVSVFCRATLSCWGVFKGLSHREQAPVTSFAIVEYAKNQIADVGQSAMTAHPTGRCGRHLRERRP